MSLDYVKSLLFSTNILNP